jgi:methanogenesis imperfect marker protein 11
MSSSPPLINPSSYSNDPDESHLVQPYIISYPWIAAIASEDGSQVELIECFDCIGGAMWVKKHYAQSPLVRSVRTVGATNRYLMDTGAMDLQLQGSRFPAGICAVNVSDTTIRISYLGMGGGGVGATICRAKAGGVISSEYDDSGGGKVAGSTITLPRLTRVLIGVDDTDTPEQGATWTLVHNIARTVSEDPDTGGMHRYLSHTIVQLFPVVFRTKNCVGVAAEFATSNPEDLTNRFSGLLQNYTLSDETGMAVYTGFSPDELMAYGERVKRGQVDPREAASLAGGRLQIILNGRGITGAVAAIPFYTRYEEALELYGT